MLLLSVAVIFVVLLLLSMPLALNAVVTNPIGIDVRTIA